MEKKCFNRRFKKKEIRNKIKSLYINKRIYQNNAVLWKLKYESLIEDIKLNNFEAHKIQQ